MTAQTSFPPPRTFTELEQALRLRAQQQLVQKRLNAQQLTAPSFRAALRDNVLPRLLDTLPPPSDDVDVAPVLPAPVETISASLEATLERIRHPRPGTPAARAVEAVERVRPIIEAHIRRRDARHNALMVMRALTQAVYTLIELRGQSSQHTTTYTFFTVLDLLPVVTGLSSDQCERATRRLQGIGLIHKSSGALPTRTRVTARDAQGNEVERQVYKGGTWTITTFLNAQTGERTEARVCAGTWVAVVLQPAPGLTARVIAHELPPCPRDLTADRKRGSTAWQAQQEARQEVRESLLLSGDKFDITPLVRWSLPEEEKKSLGTVDSRTSLFANATTPQELVWSLSRIVSIHPQHRREAVQEGAAALVKVLRDEGWEKHYYRVLWRATEAEFRGLPAFAQLASALERTLVANEELDLRRPGAWLTRQLRECGWMTAVGRLTT
ncbi:hypothetical protein [uncultured Deinococcus sp.]|uniref:hypothetical protein n=1 Tax=uncultured Deinococcus sp. TaxID=158789 RepID=UPI0025DC3BC5|nr:hypothetical protein [uncultured Deinococcus sp.]